MFMCRLGSFLSSPAWGWIAAAAMLTAYAYAPPERRFPGAVIAAMTFALVVSLLPACRPIAKTPLCPWNWAVFLFFLQLVVLPFSLLVVGPSVGVLPNLPSTLAMNRAMELMALAFISFAAAYQWRSRRRAIGKKAQLLYGDNRPLKSESTLRFASVCIALGIVGLVLAFQNIGNVINYFDNPEESITRFAEASHTLSGVASLLLRPFLGFGLVMLWCGWLDRSSGRKSPRWIAFVTLLAMGGVIFSYMTFSYNRGAFVVPLVAMIAVLLTRGKEASFGVVAVAGVVLLVVLLLAPFYAVVRNSDLTGNLTVSELLSDSDVLDLLAQKVDVLDTIQMYGSGPQYMGLLLETSRWGTRPYLGTTLFPSLVEPLPILGRVFRQSSGPVIYNEMIYGTPDIFDQILPFSGEMFLNFHIVGVIAGFAVLAIGTMRLQGLFERATSTIEVYIWQYAAVWLLFLVIGSISVVSQILFYFCWPICAYFMWQKIARRRVSA